MGKEEVKYNKDVSQAALISNIASDAFAIGHNLRYHMPSAYGFYEKISKKYGEEIILTGHSLGGNIAQIVGIISWV